MDISDIWSTGKYRHIPCTGCCPNPIFSETNFVAFKKGAGISFQNLRPHDDVACGRPHLRNSELPGQAQKTPSACGTLLCGAAAKGIRFWCRFITSEQMAGVLKRDPSPPQP